MDLATEPVTVWRYWGITPDGRLTAELQVGRAKVWSTATAVARCSEGHRPPHIDCGCGIYASQSLPGILTLVAARIGISDYHRTAHALRMAIGQVDLAGPILPDPAVLPGSSYIRGSAATIRNLRIPRTAKGAARALRTHYRVPVTTYDTDNIEFLADLVEAEAPRRTAFVKAEYGGTT